MRVLRSDTDALAALTVAQLDALRVRIAELEAAVEEVRAALLGIMPLLREITEEEPERSRTGVIVRGIERASIAIGRVIITKDGEPE